MQACTSTSSTCGLAKSWAAVFIFFFRFSVFERAGVRMFGFATSLRGKLSHSNASLCRWVWYDTDRFVPTLP